HVDNEHPNFIGDFGIGANPKLVQRAQAADCLLVVGPRLGEIATQGYTRFQPERTREVLIHVHPDPAEPGSVFPPALAVAASPAAFMQALAARAAEGPVPWANSVAEARAEYETWSVPVDSPGA